MSDVTLFVRRASGLVRAWSVFDAFIYATFSINLITLGLFIFSYCYYFEGNLATAVLIGAVFTIFQVIVYAGLISVMPRAGGDYVWQSRILGRALGFVLAVTGWWFILWLWVPLYGQMLVYVVLTPLLGIIGAKDAALWFSGTSSGLLVGSIVVCVLVFFYIAVGMKWYARIQKFCFFGGMIGLALVFGLLLFGNNQTFVANLDTNTAALFGTTETGLYEATLVAGEEAGAVAGSLSDLAPMASLALIPMIVFFSLWANWGSTLYGEVRGASDFKRNFWGMAAAIIVTNGLAVLFFVLISKSLGWGFYNSANGAFWNYTWGYTEVAPPLPYWPYPGLFAAFMTTNRVFQFIVILLMSMWWFGWSGTVFLSSTRVIFAAALDRMLPEWVTTIEPRSRTPIAALLLMVIPGIIVGYLYAYNHLNFQTLALDSTLVIAVTFFGSTIAAIILPWRQKEMYDGSPIAKMRVSDWLSWAAIAVFAVGSVVLIYNSFRYGITVFTGLPGIGADFLTYLTVGIVWILTIVNAAILVWLSVKIFRVLRLGERLPLITFSGMIFLLFLDYLLVEWFWDPYVAPFDFPLYAIGWSNVSSMFFMLGNYAIAAAIYFGFNAYRRRQGIDVSKVYKAIPVE
jgi:basic amino acid/polyamine antiporter, APA family